MKKTFRLIIKFLILFCFGGITYILVEIGMRGYSHWTMFVLGGICFIVIGGINEIIPWNMPLLLQMIIGGLSITVLEYIAGFIVNIRLGWNIWDYSNLPYNLHGQISLQFSLLWVVISLIAILADDYLRYFLFGEEKPVYNFLWNSN